MSKDNGKPRFNFRKRSMADELEAQRIAMRMQHVGGQIDACKPTEDIEPLIEKMAGLQRESLRLTVGVVEYLPLEYLKNGVKPDDVDYDDINSIMDNLAFAMSEKLAYDLREAKRDLIKN